MISLIYSPLGSVAPIILEGRKVLQGFCKQNIQWDSEVNSAVKKDWKNWTAKLRYIEQLHVRTFMKPDNFRKVVDISLHHFSDASELKKELNLGEMKEWCWTDSKVIIGYIKNDARSFRGFVAKTVQQIKKKTDVQQWCYVPTNENATDGAFGDLMQPE